MKLTYDNQLNFKRYAMKILKIDDCFYFDSIYGVDDKTSNNIPNLICDGSMTYQEGLIILKKHFNVK